MAGDLSESFIKQQQIELSRYEERRVRQFITLFESARKEIQILLASAAEKNQGYTTASLTQVMVQLDAIERQMRANITLEGQHYRTLEDIALSHSGDSFAQLGLPNIIVAVRSVNREVLIKISDLALDQIKAMNSQQLSAIRQALYSQIGVGGANPVAVARKLAGKGGLFEGQYARMENILRTETSKVYNEVKTDTISQLDEAGHTVNKRIIETIDLARNHPISPLLNGMVQRPQYDFWIEKSKVQAKAVSMRRSAKSLDKSIFWRLEGGIYRGKTLPAHFSERGTVVPTTKSPTIRAPLDRKV